MIWRSAVNILRALVRNLFQKGHQCIRLESFIPFQQAVPGRPLVEVWEWECSCGQSYPYNRSEMSAIDSFNDHIHISEKVSA